MTTTVREFSRRLSKWEIICFVSGTSPFKSEYRFKLYLKLHLILNALNRIFASLGGHNTELQTWENLAVISIKKNLMFWLCVLWGLIGTANRLKTNIVRVHRWSGLTFMKWRFIKRAWFSFYCILWIFQPCRNKCNHFCSLWFYYLCFISQSLPPLGYTSQLTST